VTKMCLLMPDGEVFEESFTEFNGTPKMM
jgi:hypothetical protein